MKKFMFVFALLGTLLLILPSCEKEEPIVLSDQPENSQVVPDQYIVVLNPSSLKSIAATSYTERVQVAEFQAKEILSDNQISEEVILYAYGTALRGFSATLTPGDLEKLKMDPHVKYVVPDMVMQVGPIHIQKKPVPEPPAPIDEVVPYYGIKRVGTGDGTGKTAWIIDTGIDYDHPDLIVDDKRAANFTRAKSADDDNGHGTHCAGIVAAIDNDEGVIGVAAGATVVPVKVLDRRGRGFTSWIIAGIDYVATEASSGDAANMSLGGGVYQPLDDAVYTASNFEEKPIYFALAAGNEADDANNHSPARVNGDYIWTVSAMDVNDYFAYFSNYGNPPVDYCMPGVSVYSTYKNGGYATMSGTSMAAPHMCGVLLMTNGAPATDGKVIGDPDGDPDPIAHL